MNKTWTELFTSGLFEYAVSRTNSTASINWIIDEKSVEGILKEAAIADLEVLVGCV